MDNGKLQNSSFGVHQVMSATQPTKHTGNTDGCTSRGQPPGLGPRAAASGPTALARGDVCDSGSGCRGRVCLQRARKKVQEVPPCHVVGAVGETEVRGTIRDAPALPGDPPGLARRLLTPLPLPPALVHPTRHDGVGADVYVALQVAWCGGGGEGGRGAWGVIEGAGGEGTISLQALLAQETGTTDGTSGQRRSNRFDTRSQPEGSVMPTYKANTNQ